MTTISKAMGTRMQMRTGHAHRPRGAAMVTTSFAFCVALLGGCSAAGVVTAESQGSTAPPTGSIAAETTLRSASLCDSVKRLMLSSDGSGSSPNFPDAVADVQAHASDAPAEIDSDLTVVLGVATRQVEAGPFDPSDTAVPTGYFEALQRLRQWAGTCE